jgi:hypothetical protein
MRLINQDNHDKPSRKSSIWEMDDSDNEPIVPAKRRRSAGDVMGDKENIEVYFK